MPLFSHAPILHVTALRGIATPSCCHCGVTAGTQGEAGLCVRLERVVIIAMGLLTVRRRKTTTSLLLILPVGHNTLQYEHQGGLPTLSAQRDTRRLLVVVVGLSSCRRPTGKLKKQCQILR